MTMLPFATYILFLVFAVNNLGFAQSTSNDTMARKQVVDIIAADQEIVTQNGIQKLIPVQVNGITQWLSIRGRDRRNPILLFLHGGPGSPTMPAAWTFQSPWEDYFTVVQWDQRGTGKTYASDPNGQEPLIELMTSDAEQVVQYLLKTYGKKKIFLLGHSWGSVLGVALAQKHPEWFYAYIGVGQLINTERNETEGYQFALREAKAHQNAEAIRELDSIAPYPGEPGSLTFARIDIQRKWLMYYGGLTWGRHDFSWDANAWTLSPDYTDRDLADVARGSTYSINHLIGPLEKLNLDNVTNFRCPVFLFEGRHDYATSHTLAEEWFQRIKAPKKKFVWFDDAAHMVPEEEPGRFLFHLITNVRPIAVRAGDAAPDEVIE